MLRAKSNLLHNQALCSIFDFWQTLGKTVFWGKQAKVNPPLHTLLMQWLALPFPSPHFLQLLTY